MRPTSIRLIPVDHEMLGTLEAGPSSFETSYGARLGEAYELICGIVKQVLGMPSGAPVPWGGYLAVDAELANVIGTCAFKAPPGEDGRIEIAYFTFPAFEGRGYATDMASELISLATTSGDVRCVIAHTLPEQNASTRILQKLGLTHVGTVEDPEDGPVWAWERHLEDEAQLTFPDDT